MQNSKTVAPKGATTGNKPVNQRVVNAQKKVEASINEEPKRYKATVTGKPSKQLIKAANGKPYVLIACDAFNSKGVAAKVSAQRNVYRYEEDQETILTDEAGNEVMNTMPEIGTECQVIENIVEDKETGAPIRFFTLSLGIESASQEELAAWADQ